jgi:hypothetical protein
MNNRFIKIFNLYKISNLTTKKINFIDPDLDEDFNNWNELRPLYSNIEDLKKKWIDFSENSGEVDGSRFPKNFEGFSKWIDENLPPELSFIDGIDFLIEKITTFKSVIGRPGRSGTRILSGIPNHIREVAQSRESQQPFDYNRWKEEVGTVESGGNYKARNKHTNALGKYQFVPSYFWKKIKTFSGNTVTKYSDFLNNPKLQEDFMKYYTFNELLNILKSFRDREKKDLPMASLLSDGRLMALFHFQGAGGAARWLKTGQMEGANINLGVPVYLKRIT